MLDTPYGASPHTLFRKAVALMSIPKISGREARNLLDGATPGPWNWYHDIGLISLQGADGSAIATDLNFEDCDLMQCAPALAETVAWLYGREPDHVGNDQSTARRGPMVVEVDWARQVHLWPINGTPFDLHITADEAVDLARALLAAAEEARP